MNTNKSFDGRLPLRKDILRMRDKFKTLHNKLNDITAHDGNKRILFYCIAVCKEYWDDLETIIHDVDWDHWSREIDHLKVYERKYDSLESVYKSLKV